MPYYDKLSFIEYNNRFLAVSAIVFFCQLYFLIRMAFFLLRSFYNLGLSLTDNDVMKFYVLKVELFFLALSNPSFWSKNIYSPC